jgi:nitrite reductase/ring-hydroxylating ferredoxin subunit
VKSVALKCDVAPHGLPPRAVNLSDIKRNRIKAMTMTSFLKTISLLIIVLILTACGEIDTTSSTPANLVVSDPSPGDSPDINATPVISGTPTISVNEGDDYSFTPVAYDSDGDALTFSIDNLPVWADFDTTTGEVSGTPGFDASGNYSNIVIHVTDGSLSASLPAYSIAVNDVSTSPPEEPTPVVTEQAPILVSANLSGSDVVLAWTQGGLVPVGGYDVFIDGVDTGVQYRTTALTVSIGGLDLEASHCFNVESRYTNTSSFYPSNQLCIDAQRTTNQSPVISGTPAATVVSGETYAFTPSASDPDNDSLSFSVANLPAWASFDSQTGAITGLPEESDVGNYSAIVISVSDGEETVSLASFAIEVETGDVVATTGSLSLKWVAPSTRADGSALSVADIDGYCIYLGQTAENLAMKVDLNDGTAESYTIPNLPVGTYFVALTAYDRDGAHSGFSNTLEMNVSN